MTVITATPRSLQRVILMSALDGVRPAGTLEWASRLAPVVTQVAVGAGHWTRGRRRRALAAWASAAGIGLLAWGLGTEAPTRAEADRNLEQQKDLLRTLGAQVPATAGTEASVTGRRWWSAVEALGASFGMVFGVWSGLRRPRRLTVLAVADEIPLAVFHVLRVARATQRRRPRIAAGSALAVAGSAARLRAAAAEPLR